MGDEEQVIEIFYHNWPVYEEIDPVVRETLKLAGFRQTDLGTETQSGIRDVKYRRTVETYVMTLTPEIEVGPPSSKHT